jgi:hypothetical protein
VPELHRKNKLIAFSNNKYPKTRKNLLNGTMVIKKFYKTHDLNHFHFAAKLFAPFIFLPFCVEFGQTE